MRGRSRVRDEDNTGVRSEPSTTNAAAVISAPVQSLLQRQHRERSNEPDCNANRIHAPEHSGGTIGRARDRRLGNRRFGTEAHHRRLFVIQTQAEQQWRRRKVQLEGLKVQNDAGEKTPDHLNAVTFRSILQANQTN